MSLDETMLQEIPPLKLAWYSKKHLIARALERGGDTHTLDDVEARLDEGLAQLITGDASAMVVEIKEQRGHRFIHIWLAGGDMEELIRLQAQAGAWAKLEYGCEFMTLNGARWKGWSRVLKEHGYEVLLKRDL